jgi:hypothetical protein
VSLRFADARRGCQQLSSKVSAQLCWPAVEVPFTCLGVMPLVWRWANKSEAHRRTRRNSFYFVFRLSLKSNRSRDSSSRERNKKLQPPSVATQMYFAKRTASASQVKWFVYRTARVNSDSTYRLACEPLITRSWSAPAKVTPVS